MFKARGAVIIGRAIVFALLISGAAGNLTGCSDTFNIVTGSNSKNNVSGSNMAEKLATYAVLGNYTVTEEELQNDVLTALASSKKNPEDARSVSDITKNYKLISVTSEVYTVPESQKTTRSAIESYI